jgi:hypothetical protein
VARAVTSSGLRPRDVRYALEGRQAKLRLRTRSAEASFCGATSSVTTLKRANFAAPKVFAYQARALAISASGRNRCRCSLRIGTA